MKYRKSIISLILSVVILISSMPIAYANVIVNYSNSNFAQWLAEGVLTAGAVNLTGPWGFFLGPAISAGVSDLASWYAAGYTDDDIYAAEADYVSGLGTSLGTYTVTNNGLRLYFNASSSEANVDSFISGNPFELQYTAEFGNKTRYLYFDQITLPFACTYDVGYSFTATTNVNVDNIYSNLASGTATSGTLIAPYGSSTNYIIIYPVAYASTATILSGSMYVDVVPVTGTVSSNTGTHVTPSTRVGSLAGYYSYTVNNTDYYTDNTYLFDESTNTINNPAAGTTATAASWVYDYETRTYTITATDGSTYVITLGDEAASETVTDSDGNSNEYDYGYAVPADSGTSSGDDDDGGILSAILNIPSLVADKIKGLFIPDEDFFASAVSDLRDTFDGRMGLLTYPVSVLFDFLDRVLSIQSQEPVFTWGSVSWMDTELIPAGSYDFNTLLAEPVFANLHTLYMTVARAILILAFLDFCRKKYDRVIHN